MQELNDNPQVVSDDFNEMYAKMFGREPITEETAEEKEKQASIKNERSRHSKR